MQRWESEFSFHESNAGRPDADGISHSVCMRTIGGGTCTTLLRVQTGWVIKMPYTT